VEGVAASNGDGDVLLSATFTKRNAACAFECICTDSAPLTVVSLKEGSLTWEVADNTGNPALGNCDNNGGKKIFPDLIDPTDGANAAQRRTVDLVATIKPLVEGAMVYFKVWDVDDPFDQRFLCPGPTPDGRPCTPGVALVDGNTSGPDNRPTGEAPVVLPSKMTNKHGKARVPFTVSMQPGNNYRAGASVISHAFPPPPDDQAKADAVNSAHNNDGAWAGYSVPLTWSPMLTVWRKLHVEIDSMDAVPQTLEERQPDWDRVRINSVTRNSTTTTFRVQSLTQETGQLASNETDHYEGGSLSVPGLPQPLFVLSTHDVFVNGSFVADITTQGTLTEDQQSAVLQQVAEVRDDDAMGGQLVYFYPLNQDQFIKTAYMAAYIDIVQLELQYNPNKIVPFDINLSDTDLQTGVGYDNAQDVWSSQNYWASLLVAAYQPGTSTDGDPDHYSSPANSNPADRTVHDGDYDFGVTVEDSDNVSLIFVEVMRDLAQVLQKDYPHLIAHEIGHSAGPNTSAEDDHNEFGIMSDDAPTNVDAFRGETLVRFRSHATW
jgi:hypothetical protein